ncbi:hypothetical protein Dimus_022059 [Dionaea muscipula]
MTRKPSSCTICETSNLASVCTSCVNYRLNEYYNVLRLLKSRRDYLFSRLAEAITDKEKADGQLMWKVLQNEKLAILREKLRISKVRLLQGKAKKTTMSHELNVKYGLLESAQKLLSRHMSEQIEKFFPNWIQTQNLGHMALNRELLQKQSVIITQICKLFPQHQVKVHDEKKDRVNIQYDVICNARLPQGLDPHSVKSVELAASLGYMVQLLNITVQSLAVPVLHNSGFAGSCSRIWQRDSYWDARPSSRSNEYPLFIPRQNHCSAGGENSWSDRSSNNFVVASVEAEEKPLLDSSRSSSFNYSRASLHTVESHKDLQNGISLLKKSVACITAYCCNSLCLDVPNDASTFGAFAKLLSTLSFSEERSLVSLKMASSWSHKNGKQLNKSMGSVNSPASSDTLHEIVFASPTMENLYDSSPRNLGSNIVNTTYIPDFVKTENIIEGWDLVEPTFPPPPSETEDVEHWTRAMFTDATKK